MIVWMIVGISSMAPDKGQVEAVLPTAAIDVFFTDSGTSGPAITTLLASQASFGAWPMMGRENNSPITPTLPPSDNDLLCNEPSTNQANMYTSKHALLVPRGTCSFQKKAYAAQSMGAGAILIYGSLGSRYAYNDTTASLIYPQPKLDYDCNYGQALIPTSSLVFQPAYNATINDPLLYGTNSLCVQANPSFLTTCPSAACLLTGDTQQQQQDTSASSSSVYSSSVYSSSLSTACCAWDLHIWLYNDPDLEKALQDKGADPVTIQALYLTMQQGHELLHLMSSTTSSLLIIPYQRHRPKYNFSAIIVWAVGVFVAWLASYLSAAQYRSFFTGKHIHHHQPHQPLLPPAPDEENTAYAASDDDHEPPPSALMTELIPSPNSNRRISPTTEPPAISSSTQSQQHPPNTSYAYGEETLELTWHHAIAFLVFSSTSLFVLFYFKIYALVKVMYGIGCSGALSQVIFIPLFEWMAAKCNHSDPSSPPRILFHCMGEPITAIDFAAIFFGYGIGIVWIIVGFIVKPDPSIIPFYWITQDIFGACMCITFLSVIRLNSIKVATLLLTAAFLYDIFFVFITPLLFSKSIMITVATSGGPPTADPTYCEKYPTEAACQGGEPLPMLFAIPRLRDYQGGASLLGLGDIVLPGLLLSLACRLDGAKRLVGLTSGGRGVSSSPNTCYFGLFKGYFYPVLIAYAIGLMMANVAVYIMQMGQPALLYLVPMCLGTFCWIGHCKGELNDLWDGPKALAAADIIAHGYHHHNVESTPATPLQPNQQDIIPPAIS